MPFVQSHIQIYFDFKGSTNYKKINFQILCVRVLRVKEAMTLPWQRCATCVIPHSSRSTEQLKIISREVTLTGVRLLSIASYVPQNEAFNGLYTLMYTVDSREKMFCPILKSLIIPLESWESIIIS